MPFPKEIVVAWGDETPEFEDNLVISNAVEISANRSGASQERTNDTIWKPVPYEMLSFDGSDQSANFQEATGLTVPCYVNNRVSVPWKLTDLERRDQLQISKIIKGALNEVATQINLRTAAAIVAQGTQCIKVTAAAGDYDDIALIDTMLNTQGVPAADRYLALTSLDYNGMAGDLAARQTLNDFTSKAYKRSYVGEVANIQTMKLDYGNVVAAAAGTTVTINGASQYYTPAATTTYLGNEINKDNRYQDIAITVGGGTVAVGDIFTVAGVNSVHMKAKSDTSELKTFRVMALVTGAGGTGTVTISPPMISGEGATDAELQYKNVTATPANGAALVFLNTVAKQTNPFWVMDAVEITPGVIDPEAAGLEVLSMTTEQGIKVVLMKEGDIDTVVGKYRTDVYFGVNIKNPEMCGLLTFNQT